MRILFLAPMIPYPPVDGDRQRAFHLLHWLAQSHTVHLLCFQRQPGMTRELDELRHWCASVTAVPIGLPRLAWNSARAWFGSEPLNVAAYDSREMHCAIRTVMATRSVDVVHAYRVRMAPYALGIADRPRVLDYTDCMARHAEIRRQQAPPGWPRWLAAREARTLAAFEAGVCERFILRLISSDVDRDHLLALGAAPPVHVVTNGVDIEALRPADLLPKAPELVFLANLGYTPNRDGLRAFLTATWPRLQRDLPGCRLTVVGQLPRGGMPEVPGVLYTGRVPEVLPFLHGARVGICPVPVASGRQFKVIEYFSAGVPAVTTSVVARNLGARNEEHLLTADHPDETATQIIRLCCDLELAGRLRRAARRLAETQYAWSVAEAQLDAAYASLSESTARC